MIVVRLLVTLTIIRSGQLSRTQTPLVPQGSLTAGSPKGWRSGIHLLMLGDYQKTQPETQLG